MTPEQTSPPTPEPATVPSVRGILLSPGEFLWLTCGVWLGGVFILTLMPVVLRPRVGDLLGIAGSYLVFFLAWQPIQSITQRSLGVKAAFFRMLVFVGGAAGLSIVFRNLIFGTP
ncbi:MAG: hypothetical protein AB7O67_09155 [Vicinamibacterales bacterium]